MPNLTIDGQEVTVDQGMTVLDAALKAGIEIPTICQSKHLLPYGACRLCTVEVGIKGQFRLQASCAYPAQDGLEVRTDTERVVRGRKLMVELLLARCSGHPAVKKLAADLGVESTRFSGKGETCVLCGQCVRLCAEVIGAGAISFSGRGISKKVQTPFDKPSAKCLACGACTFICPTGHIQMEAQTRNYWQKSLQPSARLCRYARMGFFSRKICPNDFRCHICEVDQQMEAALDSHPALVSRPASRQAPELVAQFELHPSRYYTQGHAWVEFLDGAVKLGIDDFARAIINRVDQIKIPPAGTRIEAGQTLWELTCGDKRLAMLSPLTGRIASVNPYLEVDPPLTSRDPYGRGWIALVEPESQAELKKCRSRLVTGISARNWLEQAVDSIRSWRDPVTGSSLFDQDRLVKEIPSRLDERQWQALTSQIFSA